MHFETIALIPARIGSKRIMRKNLSIIDEKPAIVRAIELAQSCSIFDRVVISTDSEEIRVIAKDAGAEDFGLRDSSFADDTTSTLEVVKYEIQRMYSKKISIRNICCIYPVVPLLTKNRLLEGYKRLASSKNGFVVPLQISSGSKNRAISVDLTTKIITKGLPFNFRTQDLSPEFQDAGQFYWGTVQAWQEAKGILVEETSIILLNKWETIDVDDPEDLEVARALYTLRNQKGPHEAV